MENINNKINLSFTNRSDKANEYSISPFSKIASKTK